ncbi:MAG TPA: carboxypeptidase-like regulatory domain-containing protein [Planctomycetota bacterium]|nr:carboxypeptidase-like regulatory domain-containing protein [Planctomycetota bacterium]
MDAVVDLETNMWDPAGQMLRPARMEDVRAGTEDVVLRLEAGASVSGVVVDAEGRAVAGRHVMAVGSRSRQAYSQQTDSQGRFTVGGLEPGPVTLTAMDANASSPASPPVKTDAPSTGIRLVLPRKATIRGRLVGENVAKFVVSAQPAEADASAARNASVEVAADGRFSLEVWEGVPFTLTARGRDDDRYALKTPVAAGADVTLELTTGLSIDGTLRAADGKTPAQAWVWAKNPAWNAMAQVGADGTWRLRGLPPGSYRIETSLGKSIPETTVEAGATGVRLDAAR